MSIKQQSIESIKKSEANIQSTPTTKRAAIKRKLVDETSDVQDKEIALKKGNYQTHTE